MDAITPARAFKWSWIACAAIGAIVGIGGIVGIIAGASGSEYGVAAGMILAIIWGPILGVVALAVTWAIRAIVIRLAAG